MLESCLGFVHVSTTHLRETGIGPVPEAPVHVYPRGLLQRCKGCLHRSAIDGEFAARLRLHLHLGLVMCGNLDTSMPHVSLCKISGGYATVLHAGSTWAGAQMQVHARRLQYTLAWSCVSAPSRHHLSRALREGLDPADVCEALIEVCRPCVEALTELYRGCGRPVPSSFPLLGCLLCSCCRRLQRGATREQEMCGICVMGLCC